MRWRDRPQSDNIEDRRGMRPGGVMLGGGGLLVVVLLAWVFGVDPTQLLQQVGGPASPVATGPTETSPEQQELAQMVGVVLRDTEDVWGRLFQDAGRTYEPARLVLFTGGVESACGMASAAMGPFYCPGDRKVYIDLGFYEDMRRRFHAPGDFAQAYVIAHEIGHHVQNQLGITDQVHGEMSRLSEAEANALSVRLELQADFLAGVWAHHAQQQWNILEEGDIEEALNAASAIGDDRLQQEGRGYIVPDSFTHGTSAQRMRWFRLGLETGDINQGDTFGADEL